MNIPDLSGNLKAMLLSRFEWYETNLIEEINRQGGPKLTIAQSRLLAVLNGKSCSISELARHLGISRQAAHKTVTRLVESGILELYTSSKGNEKIADFTEYGHDMRLIVKSAMQKIEDQLADSLGSERFDVLKDVLSEDWGQIKIR